MLKRLGAAFAALLLLGSTAFAAGTVPGFTLVPQFDKLGNLATGCKLYVIQAGTVATPQNPYQDTGLSNLQPNPMTCDATGRLPQWFVADGNIKLRLTDKNGVELFNQDNLLVIGPSSGGGGGGGGTVDPTTVAATGDLKIVYGVSVLSGWVRANGRTIGSATSGATERANSDCQALFVYLWGANANLTVSGGRGASAASDWAANKTIALPDLRGRTIAGLDDMGNSAAGRLNNTSQGFGNLSTVLGAAGGSESETLSPSQIPPGVTSSGTNTISVFSSGTNTALNPTELSGAFGNLTGFNFYSWGSAANLGGLTSSGSNNISVTTNTAGDPHSKVQPTMLATIYVKL